MKKPNFRTISVNRAKKELPGKVATSERVVVGLDVAKTKQVAAFVSDDREVLNTIHFNFPAQHRDFMELLGLLRCKVEVVLESTGTYGDALLDALQLARVDTFQIGTKKVHDARELYDGVPSLHDAKAAMIIAELHLVGLSRPWKRVSSAQRTLKAKAKTFSRYDLERVRNLGRLEAELARAWPELTQELELKSATLLKLVATYPTPEDVVADPEGASALMRKVGRSFLEEDKIKRIVENCTSTAAMVLVKAEKEALQTLAQDTYELRSKRGAAKKALEKIGQEDPSIKALQQLLGAFSTTMVLMSTGDPKDFDSPQALLKAYGLNLRHQSSGKKVGELSIAKRSASAPRHYLFFAALRLIMRDKIVSTWYQRRLQLNGGKKLKAIVAVMRKLVRAIWRIARTAKPFDAELLFDIKSLGLKSRPKPILSMTPTTN